MSATFPTPLRTRIAPSPTGIAHVGTAWMSMFDLALARQSGGQFLVRIEDTDRTRFVEGAEQKIYDAFAWLGMTYDEGGQKGGPHAPYHQSERLEIYHHHIQELIEKGSAYPCFCTSERLAEMRTAQQKAGELPRYDRHCRALPKEEVTQRVAAGETHVIRLAVPTEGKISWDDAIRGQVEFELSAVDDQVLIKSDGFPTYHFAVVVDDHLMEITHVLRGEEWISSTPKHLLLYRAFGWKVPVLAHMPLIRNADRSKLSKRKNDVSILSYRDKGYLPEALLNFIALLGWSHPEQKEIFSFDEFLRVMSLDRIQKTGPVFDVNKLNWMNGCYIRQLPTDELVKRVTPFLPAGFPKERLTELLPLVTDRLVTLCDIDELTQFFYQRPAGHAELLIKKSSPTEVCAQLAATLQRLKSITTWSVATLEAEIRALQEHHNFKKSQYFMMLRVAVTGKTATPPLFDTIFHIGAAETTARLEAAVALLTTSKNQ